MAERKDSQGLSLRPLREKAEEALINAYAADQIDDRELERRLDLVNQADSAEDLRRLLQDLPGTTASLPVRTEGRSAAAPGAGMPVRADETGWTVATEGRVRERQFLLGFWGGAVRKGRWTPARQMLGLAFQGAIDLDFRDAVFPPGVTTVTVLAIMGGVDIIVPPGITVEMGGMGIMGAFDGGDQLGEDAHAPVLRIDGLALMGGVDVKVCEGPSGSKRRKLKKPPRGSTG